MCSVLKEEFQLRHFGFNFHREEALTSAQWKWHPVIFIVFRVVVAAYLLSFTIYILVHDDKRVLFTYFTNLTFILETATFVVAAIVAVIGFAKAGRHYQPRRGETIANGNTAGDRDVPGTYSLENTSTTNGQSKGSPAESELGVNLEAYASGEQGRTEDTVPWYSKLSWLLFSMSDIAAMMATLVYFGALYSARPNTSADNFHRHLVNSLFILLDAAISARPTRLLHVIYPIGYGAVYLVFTVVYWSFDKETHIVYPILDWNKAGTAAAAALGMAFLVIPLLTFFRFGLYRLRLFVYQKIYGEPY